MKKVTISDFRARTSELLKSLKEAGDGLILIGPEQKKFVVLPLQHYNSMVETSHLLSTTANANRIMESIKQHKGFTKKKVSTKKKARKTSAKNFENPGILKLNDEDAEFFFKHLNNQPEPSEYLKNKLASYKSETDSN